MSLLIKEQVKLVIVMVFTHSRSRRLVVDSRDKSNVRNL